MGNNAVVTGAVIRALILAATAACAGRGAASGAAPAPSNRLAVIDLTAGTIVATVPVGVWPDGIGYSPRRSAAR